MKKILFPILVILSFVLAKAQMPLPCYHFDNSNVQRMQSLSGPFYTNCFDLQYTNPAQSVTDDHFRIIYTDEGHMNTEFHVTPTNGGEFHVVPNDPNIRGELDAVWYEPASSYEVPKYEKVEWGLVLPSEVQARINNWIYNDTHPDQPPMAPTINPFNPEELDVWATVEYSGGHRRINGFFYAPFQRHSDREDPNMTDPDAWYWEQLPTEHCMRIRYAPVVIGEHKVIIHCSAPGIGTWEMPAFYFNATDNSPSKSFVKVSPNGHYFVTDDNEIFFPVGMNINTLTYECNCDNIPDTIPCNLCYDASYNDPCCGLSNKLHNEVVPDLLLRDCLPLASYIKFDEARQDLKDNGANAFKLLWEPKAFDIEFEKINNYYGRQYQAWEMDRVLEDCRAKDMRIQWGMQYQASYLHTPYADFRWDWDSGNLWHQPQPDSVEFSWCYHKDLGLLEPIDFLTDSLARIFYKRKLRYMMARWGYSTQIYSMELLSEVNGIGSGHNFYEGDPNGYEIPKPYDTDSYYYRPAVYGWHKAMTEYIKYVDNGSHLLAAHYTGYAPNESQTDGVPFSSLPAWGGSYDDQTWNLTSLDVLTISNYSCNYERYATMALYESLSYLHGPMITKPMAYGENGSGYSDQDKDITNFILDLYCSSLTDHASAGMPWGHSKRRDQWVWFGRVSSFMEQFFFADADPQTDIWHPFINNNYNPRNDDHKHAIALGLQRDRNRFIGIIYNRTWNWTSMCPQCLVKDNGSPDSNMIRLKNNESSWPSWCRNFQVLGDHDMVLNIDIGNVPATYHITYFDPIDFTVISNESKLALDDKMELPNLPELNQARPFVLFKMHRTGSSFLPSRDQSSVLLEDGTEKKYWLNQSGECVPVPFRNNFTVSSNAALGEVKVLDSFGQVFFVTETSGTSVNIIGENWPSGVYFIVLENGKVFKQIKL